MGAMLYAHHHIWWPNGDMHHMLLFRELFDQLFLIFGPKADAATTVHGH